VLDSQNTIFSNSEMDRANNQFATAIYKRHERLRAGGGGLDSPQWQWHLLPEPVVSSCGPVASLQTIHMNRVESVSGARMQAIFVLLNHQDMCYEKYGEAPCNWHPNNRSQNWVTDIQDTLTAYGITFLLRKICRRETSWKTYTLTAKHSNGRNRNIGSALRSAFSWIWIRNTSVPATGIQTTEVRTE